MLLSPKDCGDLVRQRHATKVKKPTRIARIFTNFFNHGWTRMNTDSKAKFFKPQRSPMGVWSVVTDRSRILARHASVWSLVAERPRILARHASVWSQSRRVPRPEGTADFGIRPHACDLHPEKNFNGAAFRRPFRTDLKWGAGPDTGVSG